jgi:hypothetical protein
MLPRIASSAIAVLTIAILSGHEARATQAAAPTGLDHKNRALEFAQTKRYNEAAAEAKLFLAKNPDDPEVLLIAAAANHGLENYDEAITAYEKYLAATPPPAAAKADSVRATVATLKARSNRYKEYEYGNQSNGFMIGYSPAVSSIVGDKIGSDLSSNFDIGFSFGKWGLGFRYGSADTDKIQAAPKGSALDPNPVYTLQAEIPEHRLYELYSFGIVPFNDLYKPGNLQHSFLWHFGGVQNSLEVGNRKFGQIGFDLGAGFNARYFTRSPIAFDFSALYHLAIPFWGIREDADSPVIRNRDGDDVNGSSTGYEVRFGVILMFGADTQELAL